MALKNWHLPSQSRLVNTQQQTPTSSFPACSSNGTSAAEQRFAQQLSDLNAARLGQASAPTAQRWLRTGSNKIAQ